MAVTALRRVDVYPAMLRPDRPWHPEPGADAFLRSARSVCEVLGDALAASSALPTSTTLLRLWVDEDAAMPATGPVSVVVPEEHRRPPRDGWEGARVVVPADVADLTPTERRLLVLDVVDHVLRRVAPHRGWDQVTVEQVIERALLWHENEGAEVPGAAEPLVYRWASPWKASPDRRHAARAVYRIADDGFGRARIEVRRRDDDADGQVVAESEEDWAFHTREGLRRSARTLRWDGASRVRLDPYSAPYVQVEGDLVLDLTSPPASAGPSAPTAPVPAAAAGPGTGRPTVIGVTDAADTADATDTAGAVDDGETEGGRVARPWATWGMSIDAVGHDNRPVYDWVWEEHLTAMGADPAWQAWWAPAKRPRLEMSGRLTWTPAAPRVSYTPEAVRLTYPVHCERLHCDDREELARRARTDIERAVDLLSSKLRLGAAPPLPTAPTVPADLPDAYEHFRPTREEMRAFAAAAGVDEAVLDELYGDEQEEPDEERTPYIPY